MQKVVFLPGALGAAAFWHPVGGLLPAEWEKTYLSWPGLGAEPHDPAVRGFDDLGSLVEDELDGPVALVAQSLGGIVAVRAAARHPERVRRLVLVATSGGIDMHGLGGSDWRPAYRAANPSAAPWILGRPPDQTREIAALSAPTLLLWGDDDPISPIAVGERLASLLPNAVLHVVAGGTHSLAVDHAREVAARISEHVG